MLGNCHWPQDLFVGSFVRHSRVRQTHSPFNSWLAKRSNKVPPRAFGASLPGLSKTHSSGERSTKPCWKSTSSLYLFHFAPLVAAMFGMGMPRMPLPRARPPPSWGAMGASPAVGTAGTAALPSAASTATALPVGRIDNAAAVLNSRPEWAPPTLEPKDSMGFV